MLQENYAYSLYLCTEFPTDTDPTHITVSKQSPSDGISALLASACVYGRMYGGCDTPAPTPTPSPPTPPRFTLREKCISEWAHLRKCYYWVNSHVIQTHTHTHSRRTQFSWRADGNRYMVPPAIPYMRAPWWLIALRRAPHTHTHTRAPNEIMEIETEARASETIYGDLRLRHYCAKSTDKSEVTIRSECVRVQFSVHIARTPNA